MSKTELNAQSQHVCNEITRLTELAIKTLEKALTNKDVDKSLEIQAATALLQHCRECWLHTIKQG